MSFKVLPESARLKQADDDAFAKKPVGSGPFMFERRDKDTVIFAVNPHYRRGGKSPHLREVRFFVSKDPAEDFKLKRLHLLLDPDGVDKVNKAKPDRVTVDTMPNRRIHFLAVNHRQAKLQNDSLRLALARAVNRTKILDEVFRAGWAGADKPHRALNGPYLPGTWACPEIAPGERIDPIARPEGR